MAAAPSKDGLRLLDITKNDDALRAWQDYMNELIDNVTNAHQIYMIINKPYALTFLSLSEHHLSQEDFSQIFADAWIRSENPNFDKNFAKRIIVTEKQFTVVML